jgi:hypothetical protein
MLLEAYLGYATTGLAVVVLTLYYSSYMLFAVSRVFVVIVSVVSVITLSSAFAVGVGFNAESLNYHVCDIYDVAYGKYACKAVGDILPLGIVTDAGFVADAAMQGGKLGAAVVSNSSLVWSFMGSVVAVGRFWWAATVVLLVLIVWTFLSRRGR